MTWTNSSLNPSLRQCIEYSNPHVYLCSNGDISSENELKESITDSRDQGNLSELLNEMASVKERNQSIEGELKDMQERYSELSLKFAEVEGERQQLVMRLRNIKNSKKKLATPPWSIGNLRRLHTVEEAGYLSERGVSRCYISVGISHNKISCKLVYVFPPFQMIQVFPFEYSTNLRSSSTI